MHIRNVKIDVKKTLDVRFPAKAFIYLAAVFILSLPVYFA